MKKKLLVGALAVLVMAGAGCAADQGTPVGQDNPPAKDTSPIKIGWVGPLTGDISSIGNNALKAAQMAVEEVNAAGGVNGRQIQLIAEDGKCSPKDASDAGNKLINVDKVSVINGGACSGETTAIAPMAEQSHVVMFSWCSSAPNITNAGDYIFRSYPSDAFQGTVGADYAYNKLKKKKVAVFASLGDWGTGLKNVFIERFKALGGEVVLADDFNQDTRDFKTEITKMKASGADLIYFPAYTEAALAFTKQAQELGLKIQILGADGSDDAKLYGSGFAEGMIITAGSSIVKDQAWVDKLKTKGADQGTCVPQGYDNIKILADIMKRVGTDATKIKDELYKVKDYPGVSGSITIDKNGDLTTAAYDIKQFKDKKETVIDHI